MVVNQLLPRILQPPRRSFFLFGPRGTGKSTWVRQRFAKATRLDLLDEALYQDLLARPALLADLLRGVRPGSWVCLDEVQRVPWALNEVHRHIEERGLRFVLSGSSARKLRRAGVNLLGGRAEVLTLFPLLPAELGSRFKLEDALTTGTLPVVLASSTPERTLQAYVQTYLKEEIQAEALTRNLPGFARFLPVAALMHGQVLNVSSIARDAGVARTTAVEYLSILEDTLLAHPLPAWEGRLRVRERRHPKLYWIDPGLVRAVKRHSGALAHEERGALLEGLVLTLLRAHNEVSGLYDDLGYWAAGQSSIEVDFVLRKGQRLLGIEVKAATMFRAEDVAGLSAFAAAAKGVQGTILVYRGSRAFTAEGGVQVLPFEAFSARLADNSLWR